MRILMLILALNAQTVSAPVIEEETVEIPANIIGAL